MTHDERGLYITLLCVQWSQGSISPGDFERIAGGSFNGSLDRVKSKFSEGNDSLFRNERMEFERQKQKDYREACSKAGQKGGGNPNFKKGQRNPYFPYKGVIIPPLSQKHKGQINSPSPSPSPSPTPTPVSDLQSPSPKFVRPGIETMKLQGQKIGLPDSESEACFHYYETNGWKVGRNPMKNWQSAMQNWKRNYVQRRAQTYKGNNNGSHRPLTGAEQRQVGIPETPGLGAAEIIRRREQQKLAAAANGMAAPPIQPELGSAGSAGNG